MARLTDEERQEILRRIDAGQKLPDKYRTLLFENHSEGELVWDGKSGEVVNTVLPFQTVERVGAGKSETGSWTNKLIQGDNKLILSSLVNGPLREEIERHGGLKLIYIDPPFDVGADVTMNIEIGAPSDGEKPKVVEHVAYRDTWGEGPDSYLAMIHQRLVLMRQLLAEDGTIYVHAGSQVSSHLRLLLDEVFGRNRFLNEITWQRFGAHNDAGRFGNVTETIWFYAKSDRHQFEAPRVPLSDAYIAERFIKESETGRLFYPHTFTGKGPGPARTFRGKSLEPPKGRHWAQTQENIDKLEAGNRLYYTSNGTPYLKSYLDEQAGRPVQNIWTDIKMTKSGDERLDYPTQKPEALLERIISASSREGDLVADFFGGSGTTAAVAEKLGRKWICTDVGPLGIHTTRKRMITVQRHLDKEGHAFRPFEVIRYGNGTLFGQSGFAPSHQRATRPPAAGTGDAAYRDTVLRAYGADPTDGLATMPGRRAARSVAIGPVDLPVTRRLVEAVILECHEKRISDVDVLGFAFEMEGMPGTLREARRMGIDITPKYIPANVSDALDTEPQFHAFRDVHFPEIKLYVDGAHVSLKLTDFTIFDSRGSAAGSDAVPKSRGRNFLVSRGNVYKVSRNRDGTLAREALTRHWTDWIDYWSVDFDFGRDAALCGSGKDLFRNTWQSFRTKKNRSIELTSAAEVCQPGRRKVAAKVVDVFGNETVSVFDVTVGSEP